MRRKKPAAWGLLFCVIALGLILCGRVMDARHMAAEASRTAAETESESAPAPSPEPTPEPSPTPTPVPYLSPIDFTSLQKENGDVYAWLRIPDTTVDYPVLQRAGDDEYYLNRNLDGSEGLPGCVFSFGGVAKDFSRFNTILYAHNMADGTMFGALRYFADQDYFMAHREIVVYTPAAEYHYRVFATTVFPDILIDAFYDETVMQDRIDYLQSVVNSRAPGTVVPGDTEIALEDHILTLSTCVDEAPEARRLVLGLLTEIIDEGRKETP